VKPLFLRGEEKSVFKFGGSAIVLFGEPGKWRPADDILQHTTQSIETLVRLGDTIALCVTAESGHDGAVERGQLQTHASKPV
jgi:hypothetical protein